MTEAMIKVLLVEDNPADANLMREFLAGDPFQVTQVGRLEAAVQRLKTDDFDVVLLDLSLPDSERAQTVGSLHSHAPQAAIVVMTGTW